jgi:hypothetical protein
MTRSAQAMSDRRPGKSSLDLAAIAAHWRDDRPVGGCRGVFEQLTGLDAPFSGITLAELIGAGVIVATTEGPA